MKEQEFFNPDPSPRMETFHLVCLIVIFVIICFTATAASGETFDELLSETGNVEEQKIVYAAKGLKIAMAQKVKERIEAIQKGLVTAFVRIDLALATEMKRLRKLGRKKSVKKVSRKVPKSRVKAVIRRRKRDPKIARPVSRSRSRVSGQPRRKSRK